MTPSHRLVPVEATEEMKLAGTEARWGAPVRLRETMDDLSARVWAAMIAAAPQPPAPVTWRRIESLPTNGLLLAVTADGRMMIWEASILANAFNSKTPNHLQFPATHWMPLPEPPHD